MPGRKKSVGGELSVVLEAIRHQGVVIEEIRSQNRATIEVVEARFESLTQRFDEAQEETNERFAVVEGSIRTLAAQIRGVDEGSRSRDEALATQMREVDAGSRSRDEALAAQIRDVDEGSRTRDEALAAQIRDVDEGSRARDEALAAQVREMDGASRVRDEHLEVSLRELKVNVLENGVDLRALTGKVDGLSRIEDRVTALEKRTH